VALERVEAVVALRHVLAREEDDARGVLRHVLLAPVLRAQLDAQHAGPLRAARVPAHAQAREHGEAALLRGPRAQRGLERGPDCLPVDGEDDERVLERQDLEDVAERDVPCHPSATT
jgi:hypothetical protein